MPEHNLLKTKQSREDYARRQAAYAAAPMSVYLPAPIVAAGIGVVPYTLEQWRRQGKGPSYRKLGGNKVVYLRGDVEVWMAQRAGLVGHPQQPKGGRK